MKNYLSKLLALVFAALMLTSCSDPLGLNKFKVQTKSIENDWEHAGYTVSNVEVTSGDNYLSASLSQDKSKINFTSKAKGKAKVKFTSDVYKKITKDLTVDVDAQGYPWIGVYATDIKWHDDGGSFSPWSDNPDANASHDYDGTYENTTVNWKLKINGNIVYYIRKSTETGGTDSFVRGFYTLNAEKNAISITWNTTGVYYYSLDMFRGDTSDQYGELSLDDEAISNETKTFYGAENWTNKSFSVDASGNISIGILQDTITFNKK